MRLTEWCGVYPDRGNRELVVVTWRVTEHALGMIQETTTDYKVLGARKKQDAATMGRVRRLKIE